MKFPFYRISILSGVYCRCARGKGGPFLFQQRGSKTNLQLFVHLEGENEAETEEPQELVSGDTVPSR